jgi:hypothetical protein
MDEMGDSVISDADQKWREDSDAAMKAQAVHKRQ